MTLRSTLQAHRHQWVAAAAIAVVPVVALVVVVAQCAPGPESAAITAGRGELTIAAALAPDPPLQRGNTLVVELSGEDGAPVEKARVRVEYFMPAMGAMPEMRGEAEVEESAGGRYEARFDLPMGGMWTLLVDVESAAGDASLRYRLTVGQEGLALVDEAEARAPPGAVARGAPREIVIDPVRRQQFGIKSAPVARMRVPDAIRTTGMVIADQSRTHDVTLRVGGFIVELYAARPGQLVRRGDALFALYSPELYAAQLEYLTALRLWRTSPGAFTSTARAARERLVLFGMTGAQLEALARTGTVLRSVAMLSPASGYVVEKNVLGGMQLDPGTVAFRIADLDTVWVEAALYEADLPRVQAGSKARVTLPYLPGKSYDGVVSFLYPYLDEQTRVGRVRIELSNEDLELKPQMYANIEIILDGAELLVVPQSAVVYTGPRRIVFKDLGEGRLGPTEIEVGREVDGHYEVLRGLDEGELVVTSGNFLIASESRLSDATGFWLEEPGDERRDDDGGPAPDGSAPHGAH